jgi:hypothetical protein
LTQIHNQIGWEENGRRTEKTAAKRTATLSIDYARLQLTSLLLPSALSFAMLPLPLLSLADQPPGPETTTPVSESTCSRFRSGHLFGVSSFFCFFF